VEGHPPHFQIVQKADQIAQRAAQPVELSNDKCITFYQHLETFCQFRPLDVRPRGLVREQALASAFLQGGKLQIGVLVFGRDPRIADVHKPVLSLISGTTKPLIGYWRETVSKILLICSMNGPELFRRHKHGASSNGNTSS
jgi:hypothetical protein